ncbi:MAG: molecular chaperone HtpG [Clostridiales bacterium]|jgi:molecular chaperone HtpG|nr:molecular chaperone HtpG [Clostridiales bacterium]
MQEKGNLSIHSENILPIIKKWLYSDADIFVREMISNAADAITKLKKLVDLGEAPHVSKEERYAIYVSVDKDLKIIQFEDNGVGMTAEEIKEYITRIAFSGANDFLSKYQDKMDASSEIIGHFGLGFYSVFMVADKAQIDSLSYAEGAEAARWVCEGGVEYELSDSDRAERGTLITLYIGEDGKEFLDEYKLRSVLTKYCSFIPVDIFFKDTPKKEAPQKSEKDETDEKDGGIIDMDEKSEDEPKPINDTHPLWLKPAGDCTDEEYKKFYHKVFTDFNDPLFWIHLNMDYPFRLKGILFFPKLKHELEYIEGQVKLYNNQVFIADNIKEVIPEFLLLLKGVIDCPDLPLNVSRSFLQNDGAVNKMSGYISKKVADKLNSLSKKDRDNYNAYWDDISPFIKYGAIKERDFYDKVKESILYKTTAGDYVTLAEFTSRNAEKTDKTIFYVTNEQLQAQYIKMFKDQGMEAMILTTNLDNPFVSYVETYESGLTFNRIDSDISNSLKETTEEQKEAQEALEALFRKALDNEKLQVRTENLKSDSVSAIMLLSEQSRRMKEMSKMFGGGMDMPGMYEDEEILALNTANPLVKTLLALKDQEDRAADVELICWHLYDLAMLSHKPLGTDQMTRFIERSNKILERIAG